MPWYSFLLAPFALIFRVITGLRNLLFDLGWLNSQKGRIPSLVVGNLSVGGTGKTPMVEFLVRELKNTTKLVTLSRGYGRKTKGFLAANQTSTPAEIGDEPLQLYQKFKREVSVFVCEDRVAGIEKIKTEKQDCSLVILDDAFQHRHLKADFYILLTPYSKPFFKDHILPMGRLREAKAGAKRADIVVVSKSPADLTRSTKDQVKKEIFAFTKAGTPVLFSSLAYGQPYALNGVSAFNKSVILLSGLADDSLFVSYCQAQFEVKEVMSFPDHYDYNQEDLRKIIAKASAFQSENPVLLCTEKDAEKLKSLGNGGFLGDFPIFALPIEVKFEPEEKEMLLQLISKKLASK